MSAFDRHQRPGDGSFGSVVCLDPAGLGLVPDRFGRWSFPSGAPGRYDSRILRAEQVLPSVNG